MNYLVKLGLRAAAQHIGMHVGNAVGILAAQKIWREYPPNLGASEELENADGVEDDDDEPGDEPGDDEGDGALGREFHLHDLAGRAQGAAKRFARRAVVAGSQVVHRVTAR